MNVLYASKGKNLEKNIDDKNKIHQSLNKNGFRVKICIVCSSIALPRYTLQFQYTNVQVLV